MRISWHEGGEPLRILREFFPLGGAPQVVAELAKIGIECTATTVSTQASNRGIRRLDSHGGHRRRAGNDGQSEQRRQALTRKVPLHSLAAVLRGFHVSLEDFQRELGDYLKRSREVLNEVERRLDCGDPSRTYPGAERLLVDSAAGGEPGVPVALEPSAGPAKKQ